MDTCEILDAGIRELADLIESGEITCEAVAKFYLDRIEATNDFLCAFLDVYTGEALQLARERDIARARRRTRQPFSGIPIAVKDLLDIAGKPTTAGSRAHGGGVATSTSDSVAQLQNAGIVVLGKTHTVEYAFGAWGTNKWMGTPRNPWDPATHRIPGGSSSGSAVAVAAGLTPCALGTDTGGSVRIPAALNGLVGFKPTKELVSTRGCFPLSPTLDSIGPLTRTVGDAEVLLKHMLTPAHANSFLTRESEPSTATTVAFIPDLGKTCTLDDEVLAQYLKAAEMLQAAGVSVKHAQLPVSIAEVMDLSFQLVTFEAWQQHRSYIENDTLPFDPYVRARILAGKHISRDKYADLQAAHRQRSEAFAHWMSNYSALLLPTVPTPARTIAEVDQSAADITMFTRLANFLHGCAITVPIALSSARLPIGVQLVGGPYGDSTIIGVARLLEENAQFRKHHRVPIT